LLRCILFFFQAEDGIRDPLVTGVQTCALPIFIAVVWRWRYVSLGSITGALLAPVATGVLAATGAGTIAAVGYAAAAAILITLAQIGRASGREREQVWAGESVLIEGAVRRDGG